MNLLEAFLGSPGAITGANLDQHRRICSRYAALVGLLRAKGVLSEEDVKALETIGDEILKRDAEERTKVG